ncbi:MAG: sigE 34 [Gemmataceae bacterium]|nr:sigE 34 [Gemmataceae bacterium]
MASADDLPSNLGSILSRHKSGDPAAVNEIIVHCQGRLKQLTRQMLSRFPDVHRWEETSDVFHNVLIRLTRALRQLTFDTPVELLRLTACHIRRELIDLARKRRPDLVPGPGGDGSTPDPVADQPASTDDPYNLAVWEEVHTTIEKLDPVELRLFDLLYYQGLTQTEAAAQTGIPLKTLRTKWQRARVNLMRLLGNEPPF